MGKFMKSGERGGARKPILPIYNALTPIVALSIGVLHLMLCVWSFQWERLQMTASERRKIMCSVTFHVIAITCVVWSLYVLIDRTTEEIKHGQATGMYVLRVKDEGSVDILDNTQGF